MARQSIGGERRHVILPKPQGVKLEKLAQETGITVSEHIRRAIDSYFRVLELAKMRNAK